MLWILPNRLGCFLRPPANGFTTVRYMCQGLSRLCVQRVIWTPRTLVFDSLDTQECMSEFADDDFSSKMEDVEAVVSLL